ncbi:MAG: hypothetical protein Q8P69_00345 [bacterium]|nr:hypothetical protein [bacterium]
MKKFSSEFGHNYETYSFGYTNYCIREPGDKLSEIYKQGYLPYSGSPNTKHIFYMARSARVPLDSFRLTSENRRIAKKFDDSFQIQAIPIRKFNHNDPSFLTFCVDYFKKRHGPNVMPLARLKSILDADLITHIVAGERDGQHISYTFEVSDNIMTHFWYSFYDLSLVHQSLGLWLMLDSARRAQARGEKYLYLGTVYGEKALYKTAFENIEYWNGATWTGGLKEIKKLGREDNTRTIGLTDLWKKDLELF